MRNSWLFLLFASIVEFSSDPGAAIAADPHAAQHSAPLSRQLSRNVPTFTILHQFSGPPDGEFSVAGLTAIAGVLYGITSAGGTSGGGTVFKISLTGAESVVHSFSGPDGESPAASLIDVAGALYGTTSFGGDGSDAGVVFAMTTSGTENVIYRFKRLPDGAEPMVRLLSHGGRLYGTTYTGAKQYCDGMFGGCGIVFEIASPGAERVIHSFTGNLDGAYSRGGLIEVNGNLYGTTQEGGADGGAGMNCAGYGCGTVFKIDPSGTESVVHRFGNLLDGQEPSSELSDIDGPLYGTTFGGGSSGNGTVFTIGLSGAESVVYSFKGVPDGQAPEAGLIDVDGTLYGTTVGGGVDGAGSVFKLTKAGRETVLYSFTGGPDGASPNGLTDVDGTLYGTTASGGISGRGTVFSLSL